MLLDTIVVAFIAVCVSGWVSESSKHKRLQARHVALNTNYDERVREAVEAALAKHPKPEDPEKPVLYTVKLDQLIDVGKPELVPAVITAWAHNAYVSKGFLWIVDDEDRDIAVLPAKNVLGVHTGRDLKPTPVEIKG